LLLSPETVDFRPDSVERFRLTDFDADADAATAVLRYALDDDHHFEERLEFGNGTRLPRVTSDAARAGFERVVRLLHLAAGVSYYKTAAPTRIAIETGPLTEAETRLFRDLYDRGLREFAFRNGLEVPRRLELSTEGRAKSASSRPVEAPEHGIAVPLGGGKDSVVVLEALRDLDPVPVSVNPNPATQRIVSIAGLDLLAIRRRLDPALFALNEHGALNGHVPVTAIVSLITVAAGYLFGYDTTAMALESSADAPSRVITRGKRGKRGEGGKGGPGDEVNHQWSKSAEFEHALQEVLRESVHPSITYVSPLRSFDELEITAAFATLTPYLRAFRSCNEVARLSGATDAWCCDCPKCRFVFLALADALDRKDVVGVFGADILDDETQVSGYEEMLDPATKPFDCVGTVTEVEVALRRLAARPDWSGAAVLERLRPRLRQMQRGSRPGVPVPEPAATPTEIFETVKRTLAKSSLR
ncbi:MAG: hypothetical protein ACRDV4_11355, partial [Acidimicrobiales bacterium]